MRTQFMAVKIPVAKDDDDRLHLREDKIDQALRSKSLGSVLGWGDSLGEASPGGQRPVAYTRVDLDVVDVGAARTELQAALVAIGVPAGTEIHYGIEGISLADIYTPPGWQLGQPVVRRPQRPRGRTR
ncbi:hypothetical protein QTH97_29140 [Variovorax sp. J22R24]|uniref:hypothetical protein n=1 Tax=Variovorax gracilis TaxID=3053502 RepID=UPI002578A89F|nr:hypothetical protein [Variovorax sp. J22R24]MDM0109041.1 hypothetical protein [Variovorax sp. J22R24]